MAKIENHKYTIVDAFKQCFYIVPDYQREYGWTAKTIDIRQQILINLAEDIWTIKSLDMSS